MEQHEHLRALRLALKFSQSELARKAHLPRWKINTFESGDPSLSNEDIGKINAAIRAEVSAEIEHWKTVSESLASGLLQNLPDKAKRLTKNTRPYSESQIERLARL